MNRYSDRFTALLDACVLGGALRRNMLLSLAEVGFFRPRWSARILDETEKTINKITKGGADETRQRKAMETAFPDALVTGHEIHEKKLILPDPNDVHVLAAAVKTRANVIVTDNLKHFPLKKLDPHGIEALSADRFIADTIDIDPDAAGSALRRMRERFKNPAIDAPALIDTAKAQGLVETAAFMSDYKTFL